MIDPEDKEKTEEQKKAMEELSEATDKAANSFTAAGDAVGGFLGQFGNFDLSISSIIQFALEVDTARAETSKLTGGMSDLSSQVSELRSEVGGLSLTTAALYEAIGQANTSIAEFSELSKDAQGKVAGVSVKLTKLGVDAAITNKNINDLSKGLGIGAEEAANITLDLAKVGMQLGSFMTPAKIAEEFSSALPKLAAYGKGAVGEFTKLAATAKATGMEIQGLLGIAGQFDTFEDAANNTAQLNALLGTQLNSVDMLTASEGERLEMLKSNFDATGKQFDQLDRFEKKALAQAAGFDDINEAAKFFGSSLDDINAAQEEADPALVAQNELNKAMQRGVSIQERFTALMEGLLGQLAKEIMPHVMDLFNWLTGKDKETGTSPLQMAVDHMKEFVGIIKKEVLPVIKGMFGSMSKDQKIGAMKFVGMAIAMKPLLGFLGTMAASVGSIKILIVSLMKVAVVPLFAVFKVGLSMVGFFFAKFIILPIKIAMGLLAALIGWPATLVIAFGVFFAYIYANWDKISAFFSGFGSLMGEIFDGVMDKLKSFFDFAKPAFVGLGNLASKIFNLMVLGPLDLILKTIVKAANLIPGVSGLIEGTFLEDMAKSDFGEQTIKIPEMRVNPETNEIEAVEKKHQGGELVGPAIIRNDEYLMIPPKNAPPGNVMTPQQMAAMAGMNKKDDKPVTVVINIDGREFVKQTVMPALNKEFKLQGIG